MFLEKYILVMLLGNFVYVCVMSTSRNSPKELTNGDSHTFSVFRLELFLPSYNKRK